MSLKNLPPPSKGNTYLLDGDLMKISPDMSRSEIRVRLRGFGISFSTILMAHEIIIFIKNKPYYFKDVEQGRSDFEPTFTPQSNH